MESTMQLIKKHKETYRNFKGDIRRDMTTAKKLGFETEVNKMDKDIMWVNEILELLEEISVELQGESNAT